MRKTEVIPFRATLQERQRLTRMASECGMSVSELVRHIVETRRVEVVTLSLAPIEEQDRAGNVLSDSSAVAA